MDYGINGKRIRAGLGGFIDFRCSVLSMCMRMYVGLLAGGEMT